MWKLHNLCRAGIRSVLAVFTSVIKHPMAWLDELFPDSISVQNLKINRVHSIHPHRQIEIQQEIDIIRLTAMEEEV